MAVSDESAVLEVEIDSGDAFEKLDRQSQKSAQNTARQFEQAVKKVGRFWKEFFDFLKTGSDQTRARIEKIEGAFKGAKSQVAEMTAQSGPVKALLSTIEDILAASNQLPGAFRALGETIGAVVTGPLGGMLMMIREARNIAAGGVVGGAGIADEIIRRTNAAVAAGNARVLGAANLANASTAAVGLGAGQAAAAETTRLARAAGRGGGGGGGGGGRSEESVMAFSEDEAEAAATAFENSQRLMTDILKDANRQRDEANVAYYERQRQMLLMNEDIQRQSEQNAIDAKREETEAFLGAEAKKQEALMATNAALEMATQVLMKGGPAARAVGRILMAVQAAIYAQKAIGEIGEAAAAAARYDFWAAVGHAAAATSFGIAAGMKLGSAIGGGGSPSGPRMGAGGGGGGGQFAPPRSREDRERSGPINVTLVLNAAGEVVDDSAIRRLGRSMGEAFRRGYVPGRRD